MVCFTLKFSFDISPGSQALLRFGWAGPPCRGEGQIIAASHDRFPPNGGYSKGSPLISGFSRLVKYYQSLHEKFHQLKNWTVSNPLAHVIPDFTPEMDNLMYWG